LRLDRRERQLTAADEKAILGLMHDLLATEVATAHASSGSPLEKSESPLPGPRVIACAARGPGDELGLEMLRLALRGERVEVEVVSPQDALAAARAARESPRPTTLCIVALPPGGLLLCVNLCKRLKSAVPELRILIGRWGGTEDEEREIRRLRAAGADEVATTLLETRTQILTPPQPLQLPAPA
jgi:hypothetical protein